jgi:hypothetical protein
MNPSQIEALIPVIQSLPIKEALVLLISKKIYDLSKKPYESIRKIIQEKASLKKYGFIPNKEEGDFLKRVPEKVYFNEFSSLIPKHEYSDLVRTGYLLANLNRKGGIINRNRITDIKGSVCQRPNGAYLIKVINLVTTGAIVPVVDYLCELKRKGYDESYLKNSFDEILIDWKKHAFFVKAEYEVSEIKEAIKSRIKNQQKLIMVFSYGSAKNNTTLAVAELLNTGQKEGYLYESKNSKEGEKDVHVSTFVLLD